MEDPAILDNHRERPEVVPALAGEPGRSTRPSVSQQDSYHVFGDAAAARGQIVAVVRTSQPQALLTAALWTLYAEIAGCGPAGRCS